MDLVTFYYPSPTIYLQSDMLLSHIKEENSTLAMAWMDLENIMLSEISQSEKVKYHMISLICGIK